ncbi:MAG: histidinol-phosphate transaminase [Thiohalomonadales bacterium]
MNKKVQQWLRPEIRRLCAYHVPDAGDYIKLDAMENPFCWPEELQQQWLTLLKDSSVNRYPDPQARQLTDVLRREMAIPAAYDIVLGNGSDELIQLIVAIVAAPGRVVLAPSPTFVMYKMVAALMGMDYQSVALSTNYQLDEAAMLDAIAKYQPAVVFLAYPNNPTGNLFSETSVHKIIAASPGIVVLDEAYHAFAAKSFLPHLDQYDNLLILRTVSKMGLAGLRLGLLTGDPAWLREVDKVRLPYNINTLTQITATFALQHSEVFKAQTEELCRHRTQLFAALDAMSGVQAYPTEANFILFRLRNHHADDVYAQLKAAGILVKNLHGSSVDLQDCLRVTVGTASQNASFLDAMASIIHD